MRKYLILPVFFLFCVGFVYAQTPTLVSDDQEATESAEVVAELTPSPAAIPSPRPDITQQTQEVIGPFEKLLDEQELGVVWLNPLKYAIRGAVEYGVAPNTIVLLLLLTLVTAIIAAARHLIGIKGFGIFLPAALSVVFLATGPIVGILLFLVIVFVSTFFRVGLRRAKIKLQYLPRMSLMLLFVVVGVLGVLFLTPVIRQPDLSNVSIFPVLILVLLAEDFSRVQLGKSVKTAVNLTIETLIIALIAYGFLILEPVREFALLHPETLLIVVFVFNIVVGKYIGLRLTEYWRFKKLILD